MLFSIQQIATSEHYTAMTLVQKVRSLHKYFLMVYAIYYTRVPRPGPLTLVF